MKIGSDDEAGADGPYPGPGRRGRQLGQGELVQPWAVRTEFKHFSEDTLFTRSAEGGIGFGALKLAVLAAEQKALERVGFQREGVLRGIVRGTVDDPPPPFWHSA
ncbi:MAG: hypothetical protein ACM3ML_26835 [Micromonosporaceae bacterium]